MANETKLEELTNVVTSYIDNHDFNEDYDDDIEDLWDTMGEHIQEIYPEDKYDYEIFRYYYDTSDIPDAFNTVMTSLHGKIVVDSHVNTLNECFMITVVTKKEK